MRFNRQARAGYKYWAPCGCPCEHAATVSAVFVHEPGCAPVHQQNGGHSSCMQILVRTVHTVKQTVDLHRYSSGDGCHAPLLFNDRCPGWGSHKTVESPQLQCLWPLSSSWTRLLCPSVQRLWVAQCFVRLWIHVLHHPGWLWEDFLRFST